MPKKLDNIHPVIQTIVQSNGCATPSELAIKTGLRPNTIIAWATGVRPRHIIELEATCKALGMPIGEWLAMWECGKEKG